LGLFKSDEEKIKELIQNGVEFANKNENEKAVKEFQKALKIDPENEEAMYNLACTYSDMGEYLKSYELFKTIINKNPKNINAFNNLALMYARQGKYNDALYIYEKGIEHNPDAALLYNNRGNIYFEIGNYVEALKNFKKASDLDPIYSERLYHLGISNYLKEESVIDDAIKNLEQLAKKNMHKAKDIHDLGVAYMERRMYDKAIESFNKAINIDPNYLSAFINLGFAYQYKEDYVKAIQAFEKAIILNPRSAKLYNTIGLLYDKMGKPDTAVIAYKKAVNLDPTYKNSHYMLGQLYQNRGNFDKAIAEFTKHIRIVEYGPTVDDCMQRIAEMKNMTFEQVKELFAPYISEEKPEQKPQPVQPMEKKDMNEYLKNLKEKITIKKTETTEKPEPQKEIKTTEKLDIIDPQEYMRKLKEKLKQKKSGMQPPEPQKMEQQPVSNEIQTKIPEPVSEIPIPETQSKTPSLIQDMKQTASEPLLERVDTEQIETVSFEPKNENNNNIFDDPITQKIKSSFKEEDEFSPEQYREVIIKPVGKNVELPTDKMPEFRKQPPPQRNEKQPVNRTYQQPINTDDTIKPVQKINPVSGINYNENKIQKPSGTIKNDKLPTDETNQQNTDKKKKPDNDDGNKPHSIKHGFY
jgi:tetratricopeptide (TPR) repeat protein